MKETETMKNEKTLFEEPSFLLVPLTERDILTSSYGDTEMQEVDDEE